MSQQAFQFLDFFLFFVWQRYWLLGGDCHSPSIVEILEIFKIDETSIQIAFGDKLRTEAHTPSRSGLNKQREITRNAGPRWD